MSALVRIGVIAIAGYLCAATSPPRYRYPRSYPAWQIEGTTVRVLACAEVKAWVSKSGKQGVGVTVAVTPRGTEPCEVAVTEAALTVGSQRIEPARWPRPVVAEPGAQAHLYIPFAFDNEASWNRGERSGELLIRFSGGSEIRVAMGHERGAPHHKIDNYAGRPALQPQPQPRPSPPLKKTP